jgi:hypothetical protein
VKLENNATLVQCSQGLMGRSCEKPSVFEWHTRFKDGHISKSRMKKMLIIFFDIKGMVHFELIPS